MSDISGRVLIVDDDTMVSTALARVLRHAGHDVWTASSVREALRSITEEGPDLVVSDITMPEADGIDLLREVRARDIDLPVAFVTGQPTLDTARKAIEYGAFRYLVKPVSNDELRSVVRDAVTARALVRVRDPLSKRVALETSFQSALDSMWMAFQPILAGSDRQTMGYEALLRSTEPSLPHPGAVIDAAEKLGSLHILGRRTRALVAKSIEKASPELTFFVNVHPADLADADLYEPSSPLSAHASRIVLEITERASLESVGDLAGRLHTLRSLGYRLAVDDLGAGYAGLGYFTSVKPEVVKIDMGLVRGVDSDPVRQRVVASLTGLGKSLDLLIVGEGVETTEERDKLIELGCHLLQGFLFARPGPPFPTGAWGG